ncbi:MAG: PEP-CTERM sorting domain-containing protein [Bryobacteraceae bacterium]
MKLKGSLFAGLLATALFFNAGSARAAAVTGQANIAGNVNVSVSSINFNPAFTNTPGALETGSFAGLTGGTIMSLTGGPATGTVNVPSFISFNLGVATPVTFDLNYIAPGVGTLAACSSSTPGALCTPNGSPFTLLQLTSSTVVASLQLNGVAYTGSSSTGTSATTGVFSTQTVIGGTLPSIIQSLANGQSINGITYSASFVASPVPEPASMLLMGLGLAGAGLIARRKAKA